MKTKAKIKLCYFIMIIAGLGLLMPAAFIGDIFPQLSSYSIPILLIALFLFVICAGLCGKKISSLKKEDKDNQK